MSTKGDSSAYQRIRARSLEVDTYFATKIKSTDRHVMHPQVWWSTNDQQHSLHQYQWSLVAEVIFSVVNRVVHPH